MWPNADKLATKIRAIVDNLAEGKSMLADIEHKDMSESEPEEVPRELPNPKSSFVIPKVQRKLVKKKKKPKKFRRNNREFVNKTAYQMSDSSQDRLESKGLKDQKEKAQSEDEYENDFDDDGDKDQDSDEYGDDEDFEGEALQEEKKTPQKDKVKATPKKKIRVKNATNKASRATYNTKRPSLTNRNQFDITATKYSNKSKRSKVALFNASVPRDSKYKRERAFRNRSQIKHYQNLNRSAHAGKKSRPRTFGNKSHLYSSDHANSFTNLHGIGRPKKRFKSSQRQRRPLSSRRVDRKPKEQEVLITKTYDL
mmetsp:Transcript_31530/g.31019  ORF Transcript_31530/g.31019 Transcript_31530/m.31019 type:complete len:311 (+) Transcript_31530:241-1173(+)